MAEAPALQPATTGDLPDRDALVLAWGDDILDRLSKKAKARFASGRFIEVVDGVAVLALPNEPHLQRCSELLGEVETVLAERFGVAVPIRLVVDEGVTRPPPRPGAARPSTDPPATTTTDEDEESIDLDELVDADAVVGSAVERITEAFPGVSVVESD